MPTPVSEAKQCLTEEAARVLNDAMKVASRRSHTQTTSLHAVSALLALPSSALRDACSRSRSGAYPARLQFSALDLSVSVALDRLPSSKAVVDEPPVSNSLIAAIKRSQAIQRRQPETFYLYQQANQQNPFSSSSSSSCVKVELKHFVLSILDDPIVSRVLGEAGFRSSDLKLAILRPPPPPLLSRSSSSNFPPPLFLCNLSDWESNLPFTGDENSRRIGEVLRKKKSRNPLLIGACAVNALNDFTNSVQSKKNGVLPASIDGLKVISMEKEIREFACEDGNGAKMEKKLIELNDIVGETGVIVNYGDLKVLVNGGIGDCVKYIVNKLSRLVKIYGEKVWLIGAVSDYETYMKFVSGFCLVEKDWDLHLLPITATSKSSNEASSYSKKSLMGSFVPFGGFFPTPSEFKILKNQPVTRCKLCNEKYEQEVSLLHKEGDGRSTVSVPNHNKVNLPSWLPRNQSDTNKSVNAIEAKDSNLLKVRLVGLQRKWNDICDRLHQNIPQLGSQNPSFEAFNLKNTNKNEISGKDSSLTENTFTSLSFPTNSLKNVNSYSSITSVTTDLGLGTLYTCSKNGTDKSIFKNHNIAIIKNASNCNFGVKFDEKDFKYIAKDLIEKVGYQVEAICTVSRAISRCRMANRAHRGDVWLAFVGPDRVGKKKIASALAGTVFGNQENLISVDLSSEEDRSSDVKFRGKTVIDYIAEELSRKPCSVVFLENLDKADFLAQHSLSRAIKTGKFPDSYGREISVNNIIFLTTTSTKNPNRDPVYAKQFPEERILAAKQSQIQILVKNVTCDIAKGSESNVFLSTKKQDWNALNVNKRKVIETNDSLERANKVVRACLDLNLTMEEIEEENDNGKDESNETDPGSENPGLWFEDFLDKVDEKVVFEPFDFNALSGKTLKEIKVIFQEKVGVDVRLEIEEEVMVQMLAASWLSDEKSGIKRWIEDVLCKSFVEVKNKYEITSQHMVKLCVSEEVITKNDDVCLPAKIVVR